MFPIDSKAACGVWCALVLCASGQNAAPTTDERIEAYEARLRQLSKNNDYGGPRRDMSPEMSAVADHPELLENLGAEDLARMSLDEPLLKWAYARVFLNSIDGFRQMEPQEKLALADMHRRGEAVSPMLLKLMSENQENRIEFSILANIEHLETVRIEPFLDYARWLLRERTKTMTGDAAGVATYLLGRHGTKEDEALLEWVLKERPFVAPDLNNALRNLRARLNPPQPASRPQRREQSTPETESNARPTAGPGEPPRGGNFITDSVAMPWLIGGLVLALLLVAYRLLRKNLREQKSGEGVK
jgi:hypothetical protein